MGSASAGVRPRRVRQAKAAPAVDKHGKRGTYTLGCRCDRCREANRKYAASRDAERKALAALISQPTTTKERMWHVRTKGARLGELEMQMVTFKRVCAGYGGKPCKRKSFLKSNSTGDMCSYCREHVISSFVFIPAIKARRAIQFLNKKGLTQSAIEEVSGIERKTLMLIRSGKQKRTTHATEEALLEMVESTQEIVIPPCTDCGLSHEKKNRLPRLRRMLPCTVKEIQEVYPCTYPPHSLKSERRLFRDLHDLHAVSVGGLWCIREKGGTDG